jgi:hypothetical protein
MAKSGRSIILEALPTPSRVVLYDQRSDGQEIVGLTAREMHKLNE